MLAQAHYGVELSDSNIRAIYTAIVSMFVVGGMVGAMGGGYVADRLGRRRGLIFAQVSGGLPYAHLFITVRYLTQGLYNYRCVGTRTLVPMHLSATP